MARGKGRQNGRNRKSRQPTVTDEPDTKNNTPSLSSAQSAPGSEGGAAVASSLAVDPPVTASNTEAGDESRKAPASEPGNASAAVDAAAQEPNALDAATQPSSAAAGVEDATPNSHENGVEKNVAPLANGTSPPAPAADLADRLGETTGKTTREQMQSPIVHASTQPVAGSDEPVSVKCQCVLQ